MKQKCFQITTKQVRRPQQFQLRRYSLRSAHGAETEKALSPIRRRVRGTTRLPHDEARSVDRPWQPMSEGLRYTPACVPEATYEPASTACTGSSQQPVELSKSWSHTVTRLEIHNGACRCASLHIYIIQSSDKKSSKSLRMRFVIPYYNKIFIFAVLERWLTYDCETECSFVYLILAVLVHKFNHAIFEVSNFNCSRYMDLKGISKVDYVTISL